ncbi:prepilin-type N-terminal cleavage/methylation domain-containing protein [Methylobacter tundripaludum]|uniref:General secretion pathway protein H n=1 Tax=Methylobacter tundripaludum (strain ATCC BAA-1195 / DSM 17260 / SV96) TaxID=697282 RepID=G3IYP3_METTV|nr:general secretion pathway protein H [Methylobacter tundripaludum SV96]
MSRRCNGFSLIELIVIIVIMGILTAYAAPRLNFAGHAASDYAEIVKSSIRLAQKLAIAHRTTHTITFPVNPCNGSSVNGLRVAGEQCDPLPNGVSVSGLGTVTFNGLGRPNVATVTTITVSGGDVIKVICLEPETGYVHEETAC